MCQTNCITTSNYIGFHSSSLNHSEESYFSTYIESYTCKDKTILRICSQPSLFNSYWMPNYLLLKDNQNKSEGFLYEIGGQRQQVYVSFKHKELRLRVAPIQDLIFKEFTLLSNKYSQFKSNGEREIKINCTDSNDSSLRTPNYLFDFYLMKGEREESFLQSWGFIFIYNICCFLYCFCLLSSPPL